MSYRLTNIIVLISGIVFLVHSQVSISGTITDAGSSAAIQGAIVSLTGGGVTDISDENGHYNLGGTVAALPLRTKGPSMSGPRLLGNRLHFSVPDEPARVRIDLYTLSGRLVRTVLDQRLSAGEYHLAPLTDGAASGLCLLRVRIGGTITVLKVPVVGRRALGAVEGLQRVAAPQGLVKTGQAADTLIAWAVGYDIARLGIESLTGTYDLALQRSVPAGEVQLIQTSQAGDRVAVKPSLTFIDDDGSSLPTITVDPDVTCQEMVGFGAAFTETSVYNMTEVGPEKMNEILNAFFNPYTGAGYTFLRTHINSCDFCLASYSYDDTPGDYDLVNFDISHELQWMIPRILDARAVPGSDFIMFGSPWAPPAWMKTTNEMLHGGELKPDCYEAWALYFVKYIEAMEEHGVDIWGVTIQNEPEFSPPWEGCRYTAQQMRDFLKNHLGPTFERFGRDENIMIFDHNKDHVAEWAEVIFTDSEAAQYAWGTAYHWYSGDQFYNLDATHTMFPDKHIIGSENSLYDSDYGQYSGAERMAHSMIGDINNWSAGYQTWNLVTDIRDFGPSHAGTRCPSPIMVDIDADYVEYHHDYYYMTHFSKYVRPGAVRIECGSDNNNLETTAFKNTNGSVVVIVLNRTNNAIAFKITDGTRIIKPTIPAHAMIDFIY